MLDILLYPSLAHSLSHHRHAQAVSETNALALFQLVWCVLWLGANACSLNEGIRDVGSVL